MTKKHTFVICAYQESPYLEECIKSVIRQRDYSEVILATSTPNDHISGLCSKYDIPVYINTGETGITQDWEYALSCAATPIATLTHQDDVYFEDYSKEIVRAYDSARMPLIFFTDYYEIRDGKYVRSNKLLRIKQVMLLPLRIRALQRSRFIRRRILSLGSPICCPSVAYSLENLPRPLFMNHFRTNEDWEAWERYSRLYGDFIYIHKPLMGHRIHADSATTAMINDGGRSTEDYEMFSKFWPGWMARILTARYKASERSNDI